MKNKVLLISYTLPPAPGIGGRRWVKFAKYLHLQRVDLKVIAAKNQSEQQSVWIKDLEPLKDRVTYLDSKYPHHLGMIPKTAWQKVLYRLSRWYCMLKVQGNYYDKSAHWSKDLIPIVEREIANGYNNIIVTCAPFIQAYHLCTVKDRFPEVNFIVDFRDPWVNNKTDYGFSSLSPKRQAFEVQAEKRVAATADYVLSVSDEMSSYFQALSNRSNDRCITLRNGFDRQDFPLLNQPRKDGNKLRFIFTGTLYDKAMHLFPEFIAALDSIQQKQPEAYAMMQFDFYGKVPENFFSLVERHSIIAFKGSLPLAQVYTEIAASDLGMLFLTDDLTYSLSTKFYEYMVSRKPVACFSKKGKTSDFIDQERIGYALNENNMEQTLLAIVEQRQQNNLRKVDQFDTSSYDISNLTEKILALLK